MGGVCAGAFSSVCSDDGCAMSSSWCCFTTCSRNGEEDFPFSPVTVLCLFLVAQFFFFFYFGKARRRKCWCWLHLFFPVTHKHDSVENLSPTFSSSPIIFASTMDKFFFLFFIPIEISASCVESTSSTHTASPVGDMEN